MVERRKTERRKSKTSRRKKYTVNWRDDEVESIEIDGVTYERLEDIPDEEDRDRVWLLMDDGPGFDVDIPQPGGPSLTKLLFPLFLGVALLMVAIAVLTGVNTARALAREASAPGYVVDLTVRRSESGQEYHYPRVEFALPDGSRRTVQLAEGSWPPAYEPGEEVTVLYNPERPLDARIASAGGTFALWTWTLVTGILGLAFIGASLLARWIGHAMPDTP